MCDCVAGENISEEAAQVLQKGLDECARIGEVDTQALFMVEGAELEAQTGNKEDSMALLQVQAQTSQSPKQWTSDDSKTV